MNNDKTVIYYTIRNKEDYYDDDDNPVIEDAGKLAYAKKVLNEVSNVYRYYIRINNYGKFFNPIGLYNDDTDNSSLVRGQDSVRYTEVDKNTFERYLKFLKSKNKAYLMEAERGC